MNARLSTIYFWFCITLSIMSVVLVVLRLFVLPKEDYWWAMTLLDAFLAWYFFFFARKGSREWHKNKCSANGWPPPPATH